MNDLHPHGLQYSLELADGIRWVIAAGNEDAVPVVSQLCDAMQLQVITPGSHPHTASGTGRTGLDEPFHRSITRRLLVLAIEHNPEPSPALLYAPFSIEDSGFVVCTLRLFDESAGSYLQLLELSLIFARYAQTRGGVLLHGALAEKDSAGIILAAPGGTGKTTASNRLPTPWHSLCDDTTLVVRDIQGNYRAHPWPTWSRFVLEKSGGAWDVQNAVPLKGIFFLSQAVEDHVESIGPGHSVSLLVECAEQNTQLMTQGLNKEETRSLHLERFNNICALARVVPSHVLRISLTGTFWEEIVKFL